MGAEVAIFGEWDRRSVVTGMKKFQQAYTIMQPVYHVAPGCWVRPN